MANTKPKPNFKRPFQAHECQCQCDCGTILACGRGKGCGLPGVEPHRCPDCETTALLKGLGYTGPQDLVALMMSDDRRGQLAVARIIKQTQDKARTEAEGAAEPLPEGQDQGGRGHSPCAQEALGIDAEPGRERKARGPVQGAPVSAGRITVDCPDCGQGDHASRICGCVCHSSFALGREARGQGRVH